MFKLVRYFSISSLLAFVIVAVFLGIFYRRLVLRDLVEIAESKNIALTQSFSNSLWPEFVPLVETASSLTLEELQAHPDIPGLHQAVLAQMNGLSVVKVKVYNLDGLTVFSTEARQIGEDKRDNAGFLSARSGKVASELTHRDSFSAFESTIEDRDVFSSYVPIRQGGNIEGVFEVYDDVTPLVQRLDQVQWTVTLGVTAILALLYFVLFFIVKRADNIIKRQYLELQESEATLRRSEQALAIAHAQALEGSRLKSQLLANVSHDLRTPLNAIIGYAEMLQEGVFGPLVESQQQTIREIMDSAGELLHFVTNLLNQAQIESGKIILKTTAFAPAELIDSIRATLNPLAQAKGLAFNINIDPEMPPTLYGDPYWLRQAMSNLIGNAIKFTEQGSIHLRVYQPDAQHWAFQVSDTGSGIPPEAQEYIFETFRQVDGTITRQQGGSGLGLSIVKQLVTLMQGQITLTSELGRGSTFTLTLPLLNPQENKVWQKSPLLKDPSP